MALKRSESNKATHPPLPKQHWSNKTRKSESPSPPPQTTEPEEKKAPEEKQPPKQHWSDASRISSTSSPSPKKKKKDEKSKEDVLKPGDPKSSIDKPKKKHGWRNFFIFLVVLILIILIGVAATGIYVIPGISDLFGFNKPKDLGVEIGPEHLETIKEKVPMKIQGEQSEYASGNEIFSGEIAVDTEFTANEVSSWLDRYRSPDPIVDNLQVRQYEGGMELSGMITQYVNAPAYAKVDVTYTEAGRLDLNFQEIKVGAFSVPDQYVDEIETFFENKANDLKNRVPGFSIETYELHDGYSTFKGTFPETVKPSPNGWADLLNY